MWSLQPDLAVDLVLLDVMLPGVSGFDLLRALRAKGTVPVIMLSARNEEADRVLGLELGADDYVAKPFGRPELRAHPSGPPPSLHRALAGRRGPPGGARFRRMEARFAQPRPGRSGGAAVDLSGAEHDLLLVFLEHPGRVLGREQILEMCRGRLAAPSDRSVDTLVSRLRRKLEPPEGAAPVIKTVRGSGYMLSAKVVRA